MARLIGALLLLSAALLALKAAFALLLVAGAIFRTRETLVVVALLGAMALLRNYPAVSYSLIGGVVVLALAGYGRPPAET